MPRLDNQEIGRRGEEAVKVFLQAEGYEVIKFGREEQYQKKGIPESNWDIGSSLLFLQLVLKNDEGIEFIYKTKDTIPECFDFDKVELIRLVELCRSHPCGYCLKDPTGSPCNSPENMFNAKYLERYKPNAKILQKYQNLEEAYAEAVKGKSPLAKNWTINTLYELAECNSVNLNGYEFFERVCHPAIKHLAISESYPISEKSKFIRDHYTISSYVEELQSSFRPKLQTLPLDEYGEYNRLKKSNDRGARFQELHQKKKIIDKINSETSPPGYPGRFDYIAFKNGSHIALEVKANTSKLTYWQKLRLGLLQKMGHDVKIVKVSVDKHTGAATRVNWGNFQPLECDIKLPKLSDVQNLAGRFVAKT